MFYYYVSSKVIPISPTMSAAISDEVGLLYWLVVICLVAINLIDNLMSLSCFILSCAIQNAFVRGLTVSSMSLSYESMLLSKLDCPYYFVLLFLSSRSMKRYHVYKVVQMLGLFLLWAIVSLFGDGFCILILKTYGPLVMFSVLSFLAPIEVNA